MTLYLKFYRISIMKKVYEVIRDGSLEQSFEKSRDGMNDALELVEQLAVDWMDE